MFSPCCFLQDYVNIIDNLSQEEKDLVLHAADYDLLKGMKDGTEKLLQPNKYLTRGEAAAALMRIY